MALTVYPPSVSLRPFIRSFTIEETTETAVRKVLPGTAAVLGFQFRGSLSIVAPASSHFVARNSADTTLAPSGITGLHDSFRLFRNSAQTGTLLVHFTETGAANFFTTPLHLLFNGSYSLGDLIPASEINRLEEQLTTAPNNITRIAVIERWLLSRLHDDKKDALIEAAVTRIYGAKGQLRIATLGQELYVSPSRLEKRFRALVGATPKKFAGLVRFRQILKTGRSINDLTSLAYEAGYFDQAHFIHDFTAYTGSTPADYFRKRPDC